MTLRLDGKFNFSEIRKMLKAIGSLVVFICIVVYSNVLNGWALSILWGWFIIKAFGLPVLSIPLAIGVALVVGYITHQVDTKKDEREIGEILFNGFLYGTAKPLIALSIGWVVHLFI